MRQKHHLLLIDRNSVGFFQIFFHCGKVVFNLFLAVFSSYETWNVFHRTRTIKRVHSNKICKYRWLQFLHIFLHSGRFILKNPNRIPSLEQLVGFFIIERKVVWIEINVVLVLYEFYRVLYQRQGFQTEEIHFQKARTFNNRVIELSDVQIGILCSGHGNEVGNIAGCNNYPAGVDSCISDRAFENFCLVYGLGFKITSFGKV